MSTETYRPKDNSPGNPTPVAPVAVVRGRIDMTHLCQCGHVTENERCDDCEIAFLRDEVEGLRAEVAELRKPTFYWDDRNLDCAIEPDEVVAYDDVGDIVELRPIHELPTVFALVTDEGPLWFSTREAAEAARGE